ncbi:unnamed protein product [Nesidiocoris tenuis]|uniref:Condensin complex subunit 1 C-terminal domain-containing protein n=1 Tax=Nesidiocoris tenuis TaxID=355587 RepID=A0A6H5GTX3_9HEMI|nr:unnamed protein product [Nesidiocoris tenuis]
MEVFTFQQKPAKTTEEAMQKQFQFWNTQPVPKMGRLRCFQRLGFDGEQGIFRAPQIRYWRWEFAILPLQLEMSIGAASQAFENYEKSRVLFAQTMADMALRSVNVDCMLRCNVMELLTALLNDPSLRVQQNAALAIGRIANNSHEAARIAMIIDTMQALLRNIEKRSRQAMCALSQVAKHTLNLAEAVVETDVVPDAILHMGHPDGGVMKSAANLIYLPGSEKFGELETENQRGPEVDIVDVHDHVRAGATVGHSAAGNSEIRLGAVQPVQLRQNFVYLNVEVLSVIYAPQVVVCAHYVYRQYPGAFANLGFLEIAPEEGRTAESARGRDRHNSLALKVPVN